jgi:hypothetical protein
MGRSEQESMQSGEDPSPENEALKKLNLEDYDNEDGTL